ncbi:tripartite tricarboxylate transporter TctB family protein [Caenimonas aquaedulcis]|uniref:Tripartite tricarboxylate transporter TctB family protein n=1 Tax=Caenimonas aquaedulcis TaxID=2793270 RepID=A0A931H549_9BURK|nr:tripartite tricarboxylate transporter TctB family protein [Caenimonas aquaedulcis]MBG9388605.1 tripartite tricarboxylate transporter TctB family protein [Caenimonas aquaedulcis]
MTPDHSAAAPPDGAAQDDAPIPPRSDLKDAIGWTVLGIAVLAGSLSMDRLERQSINPYTIPGLLPALLGIVMILLGLVLGLRSWRRGAFTTPLLPAGPDEREQRLRIAVVLALCVGYGVVLIGHGIPFWVASTIYVTASILVMQRMSRDPQERELNVRVWAKALVIGAATSVITQLAFQELFLVRMP